MPRKAKELSAAEVKRLPGPAGGHSITHTVGGEPGLLLQITATGVRSWIFRYSINGRRREMGLGVYGDQPPRVSLRDARQKVREMRDLIQQGRDPLVERKAERDRHAARFTFGMAADSYLKMKTKAGHSSKNLISTRSLLDRLALPDLGSRYVDEIEPRDLIRVLSPLWHDKPRTAQRLKTSLQGILTWATAAGHREGLNPALGIATVLGPIKTGGHRPALTLEDAPRWFAELREREGIEYRAIEFAALTATRSGDVRGALWDEIEGDIWTIPAARMKAHREHRVPLPPAAVELLAALPRLNQYVFPAQRSRKEITDEVLARHMRYLCEGNYLDRVSKLTPVLHGLRSTFRDWTATIGYDRDLAELCLAHQVGSAVERAYLRTDMIERRRALMADWSGFLAGREAEGSVVPMRRA